MNRFKRKLTALAMATMIALTAALPASASTLTKTINNSNSYENLYVYGNVATIRITNLGYWYDDQPIQYTIYGVRQYSNGVDWPIEGYVYPNDEFFEEFTAYEGYFDLDIRCPYSTGFCSGEATIEVIE